MGQVGTRESYRSRVVSMHCCYAQKLEVAKTTLKILIYLYKRIVSSGSEIVSRPCIKCYTKTTLTADLRLQDGVEKSLLL